MPRTQTALLSIAFALCAGNAWSACARNEYGVFEDLGCASEALAEAEAELNTIYKKVLQSVDRPQQKALAKAQRNWLAFLSAQAEFVYAAEGDGSSGRLVLVNEREELMRARAKTLRNWVPR